MNFEAFSFPIVLSKTLSAVVSSGVDFVSFLHPKIIGNAINIISDFFIRLWFVLVMDVSHARVYPGRLVHLSRRLSRR